MLELIGEVVRGMQELYEVKCDILVVGVFGVIYGLLFGFGMFFLNVEFMFIFLLILIKVKYFILFLMIGELYLGVN